MNLVNRRGLVSDYKSSLFHTIYFVNQLRKEGYQGVKDEDVVDQWFQKVCRNVALETWENYDADPENRTTVNKVRRDDGKTEVS